MRVRNRAPYVTDEAVKGLQSPMLTYFWDVLILRDLPVLEMRLELKRLLMRLELQSEPRSRSVLWTPRPRCWRLLGINWHRR